MQQNAANANDSVASRPSGRQLHYDTTAETEADGAEAIQILEDMINKGKQANNSETIPYVDLPNTAPPDSGLYTIHSINDIAFVGFDQ